MDRGIPTEEVLAEMRRADPPVQYLVGTPKGRLNRLEHELLDKPWQAARPGVQVKLLPRDGELYVFAESADRVAKERSMRRRQLKWLWARLKELAAMEIKRDDRLMKLGAARARAPTGWRLVTIEMDTESSMFTYSLNRQKLRQGGRGVTGCAATSPIPPCCGVTISSLSRSNRPSRPSRAILRSGRSFTRRRGASIS
jgi:hypothetical protein